MSMPPPSPTRSAHIACEVHLPPPPHPRITYLRTETFSGGYIPTTTIILVQLAAVHILSGRKKAVYLFASPGGLSYRAGVCVALFV